MSTSINTSTPTRLMRPASGTDYPVVIANSAIALKSDQSLDRLRAALAKCGGQTKAIATALVDAGKTAVTFLRSSEGIALLATTTLGATNEKNNSFSAIESAKVRALLINIAQSQLPSDQKIDAMVKALDSARSPGSASASELARWHPGTYPPPFEGTDWSPRQEGPDPNRPIETVYVGSTIEGDPNALEGYPDMEGAVRSLQAIGKKRGFDVAQTSPFSQKDWAWIHDGQILYVSPENPKETIVLTSRVRPDLFASALESAMNISGRNHALGNPIALGESFKRDISRKVNVKLKQENWNVRETPLALDGGNLIPMRDKNGQPLMLLGFDSLLVNSQILKLSGQLDPAQINKIVTDKTYDGDIVKKLLSAQPRKGVPMTPIQALTTAAEIEYTRRYIAQTLNVSPAQLAVLSQPVFHIDMMLRPVKDGVAMLADMRQSQKLLSKLADRIEQSDAYIESPEGSLIRREVSALRWMQIEDREDKSYVNRIDTGLDRTQADLEKAGVKVIRAPLTFGADPDLGLANVANGFVAIDRANKPYFVTNDTGSPALNKEITKLMADHGIEVEFAEVGQLLTMMGGIQCSVLYR